MLFSPYVCILKMPRIFWRIQMCMKNMKKNLTPDLPPPPKPSFWDRTPQGVENFFTDFFASHMRVQNDQRNEGIILRYVFWGTPPRQGSKSLGVWDQGLSLSTPHGSKTKRHRALGKN